MNKVHKRIVGLAHRSNLREYMFFTGGIALKMDAKWVTRIIAGILVFSLVAGLVVMAFVV